MVGWGRRSIRNSYQSIILNLARGTDSIEKIRRKNHVKKGKMLKWAITTLAYRIRVSNRMRVFPGKLKVYQYEFLTANFQ